MLDEHVSSHLEEACFLPSLWVPALRADWVPFHILRRSPSSRARSHLCRLGHVSDGAGPSWVFRGSSQHKSSQIQDSLLADTRPSVHCLFFFIAVVVFLILFLAVQGLHCCEGCSVAEPGGGCSLVVHVLLFTLLLCRRPWDLVV